MSGFFLHVTKIRRTFHSLVFVNLLNIKNYQLKGIVFKENNGYYIHRSYIVNHMLLMRLGMVVNEGMYPFLNFHHAFFMWSPEKILKRRWIDLSKIINNQVDDINSK
jgi:hypothetical protein